MNVHPMTGAPPESVLLVLQGASPNDHPGIVDGYERLKTSDQVRELTVFPVAGPRGIARGEAFWRDVVAQAHAIEASLVAFTYYHSPDLPDPRAAIHELRKLPSQPFVISTLGDPFMNGILHRPSVPRSFIQAAEASDLVLLTSMGALADLVARKTRAAIMLLPHGACQVRFSAPAQTITLDAVDFDVVFIGSRNSSRNPARPYYWLGRHRERLVEQLSRRHGNRFAVFGRGWDHLPNARGFVPFAEQLSAVRRARVVVGGVPFSRERYYASDRPFIQMLSGVPLVDVAVTGISSLARDREHWLLVKERYVADAVDEVLTWSAERRSAMASAAATLISERHTQAHRVAALIENVRRRRSLGSAAEPYLPFFLDDSVVRQESRFAIRNWDNASH